MLGPFIFFDHMGPATFAPGSGINVRQHPHIGLATVTYLFEGEILHRDSLGVVQVIRPGEVNWMTAGRGIVHSEKVTSEVLATGQRLHGLQVWVALPEDKEDIEPRFEHYGEAEIPGIATDGMTLRIVLGSAYGKTSPVRTESETLYVACELEPAAELSLPLAEELGVYVVEGEINVEGERLDEGVMAIFPTQRPPSIRAATKSRVVFIGGDRLSTERFIEWNFVSSSRERIEQAKEDWRENRFARVPNETDFTPLP
jgi:redox-sensitive bicupin YhaK (pirin superfamily)